MNTDSAKATASMGARKPGEIFHLASFREAFTLIELLVIVGILFLLGSMFITGLARTQPAGRSTQCLNSLRQLTLAWRQYSEDNRDVLLTCETMASRVNWVSGNLSFASSDPGNWDPSANIYSSPLFPYCAQNPLVFRCPADRSTITIGGTRLPRVRSRSMSQVFGSGAWLDKNYNAGQRVWRTYGKLSAVMVPAKTFVFLDEHPDSINDGAFASACTGNQPNDPPSASLIIDFPANYHNSACGFSFADGHSDIHRWIGLKSGRAPITYTGTITLNVSAGDSWVDMHWLAENTTVRN
jgi:prepilin-type processing-associated H-X9-DG protein